MSHGRVLLLEDDLALRGLLQEALLAEDFNVHVCDSFEDLKIVAAKEYGDIIVADFWGGGQRTLEEAEREQIGDLTRLLPVVLLTGRTWAVDTTADELGTAALIRKPFDLGFLLGTIERILEQRRSGRASR